MLETIKPPYYDVCFIGETSQAEFDIIKEDLHYEKGLVCKFGGEAKIIDGVFLRSDKGKSGIIIEVTVTSIDEKEAVAVGSWFSTSTASQSVRYWLERDAIKNTWTISKKKILMTS